MMRRGPVSMVPRDQQMTEDEEFSQPVGARGGTRGPRRTLAQKIADAKQELVLLQWGGVRDAAGMISPVIEALEDGEDKNELFSIYERMNSLLQKNGMDSPVAAEG